MGKGAWLRLGTLAVAASVSAGCTGTSPSQAQQASARPTPSRAASAQPTGVAPPSGPVGSPGHPLSLGCGEEAIGNAPQLPGQQDLVVGPLDILNARLLPTANPSGWGEGGAYKVPFAVGPNATVTVVIAPPARGYVAIDNPYGPPGGVAAATYHSCQGAWTVFAQGFAFRGGRTRGCVPLDVRIAGQPAPRRVTLSLFAGTCAA